MPAAPGYDPWMWLLWGRELAGGALDTSEGPAFKPLPVAICTLLAPLGAAAPGAWLVVARAGALLAVALGALLAYRLAGAERPARGVGARRAGARTAESGAERSRGALLAGAAAGAGVALTGGLPALSAAGAVEGASVAGALGAVLAWRDDRIGLALVCGVCCALIRVEAIPFVALAAVRAWRERPALRPALLAGAVAVPAAWFLPDLIATGDALRSAARARIPNPGQPALAEVPALDSLSRAAGLALLPVALGALALRRRREPVAFALATAALCWLGLVAVMAQFGFSGEERYALPGVAVLSVAGAVGLARIARLWRFAPWALAALLALAAVPRLESLARDGERLAYAARLDADLERAVSLAGGRDAVLSCGRPIVGDFRGPLLAYRLAVAKRRVVFSADGSGVAFASRLSSERLAAPVVPSRYRTLVRAGTWKVSARCGR